jgi:hypothetical protein
LRRNRHPLGEQGYGIVSTLCHAQTVTSYGDY